MTAPRLILITDPAYDDAKIRATVEAVARALPAGALLVQLRDKTRPRPSLRAFAIELSALTRRLGASLAVNGDVEIARDAGATGVHLGRGAIDAHGARLIFGSVIPWISVAAHSDDEVRNAVHSRAQAVLVSPIFAVPGKGEPRGLSALTAARAIAPPELSIYALGGISAANAALARQAGADGVAVMRALLGAEDPARQARAIYDALV